jgi:hypothetical protein
LAPTLEIHELLRKAIRERRLVQFVYKDKQRIVEPHDYGIHKGSLKLLVYQVAGFSNGSLPTWRWMLVNWISDLRVLEQQFPSRWPSPPSRHYRWEQLFARVEAPEQASVTSEQSGSSSSVQAVVSKKGGLRGWGKLRKFRNDIDPAFTSEVDQEVSRQLNRHS